jgi:hypothetical protein
VHFTVLLSHDDPRAPAAEPKTLGVLEFGPGQSGHVDHLSLPVASLSVDDDSQLVLHATYTPANQGLSVQAEHRTANGSTQVFSAMFHWKAARGASGYFAFRLPRGQLVELYLQNSGSRPAVEHSEPAGQQGHLRRVDYEVHAGAGPGRSRKSGPLKSLVTQIPYFLAHGVIPPLPVVNAVLRTGAVNAGMSGGCTWEPFEIAAAEYETLVEGLRADGLKTVDAPDWVQTGDDWTIWQLFLSEGVPVEEHRRLTDECNRLERQRKAALEAGNSALAEELLVESVRAGNRLAEFVMANSRTSRQKA